MRASSSASRRAPDRRGQGELQRVSATRRRDGRLELARELADRSAERRGSTEAVQHQITRCSSRSLEDQREELVRQFSAEDGPTRWPTSSARVNQARRRGASAASEEQARRPRADRGADPEIVELKEQHRAPTRRVAEAEEAGTRKGRSFEERVHDAIERDRRGARRRRPPRRRRAGPRAAARRATPLVELGAGDGPAAGRVVFEAKDSRLSQERRLARAQRRDGRARRRLRRPGGRRRRQGPRRTRAAARVRGQQDDRRRRSATSRPGSALELAYRYAAPASSLPARGRARGRRRRRSATPRRGDLGTEAGAERSARR